MRDVLLVLISLVTVGFLGILSEASYKVKRLEDEDDEE